MIERGRGGKGSESSLSVTGCEGRCWGERVELVGLGGRGGKWEWGWEFGVGVGVGVRGGGGGGLDKQVGRGGGLRRGGWVGMGWTMEKTGGNA